jgi:hypothetical protein
MPRLEGVVVRMGSLEGQPLYGVRLRAVVCSRSARDADHSFPSSFRVAHYVIRGRMAAIWGRPFRVMDDELHWLVSLGESTEKCGRVTFEDVIPPDDYQGLESPLGVMGFTPSARCYGIQLTLRAGLESHSATRLTPISATRRTVIQCGRFRPH